MDGEKLGIDNPVDVKVCRDDFKAVGMEFKYVGDKEFEDGGELLNVELEVFDWMEGGLLIKVEDKYTVGGIEFELGCEESVSDMRDLSDEKFKWVDGVDGAEAESSEEFTEEERVAALRVDMIWSVLKLEQNFGYFFFLLILMFYNIITLDNLMEKIPN